MKYINDNQLSKYLLYAIGEIILVVIGILIALKVNDWNENRKEHRAQTVYLSKLKEDISGIKSILDNQMLDGEQFILEAQQALFYVQQCTEDAAGRESLENVLLTHGNLGTINVIDATYSEMLSNGAFSRLQNDSLKTALSNLYSGLEDANTYIAYFREELGRASDIIWRHSAKEFIPDITLDYRSQNQLMAKYNLKELCESNAFKNALAEVYDSRQDLFNISGFINRELENTLNLLNSEIKKKND